MSLNTNRTQKRLTITLFFIYLIVLSWIILFKMQVDISLLKNMKFRNINLIPFAGSLIVNGKADISEIILNVIAFIPFGVYISMLKGEWGFLKKIAPIFAVSLTYEILQYLFAIGGSDITDLLGNTLGGTIGIALFFPASKIWKAKAVKIVNVLALIGTTVMLIFLGLLIAANR